MELAPGTRLEGNPADRGAGSGTHGLTTSPDTAFGIRLDGDRIRSTGTLPLQLRTDGPIRAHAGLRVSALGGTLTAPRVRLEADGRIEDDAAGLFAEGSLELGLSRDEGGLLRIEPDGRLEASRLGQTGEGGWQLAGASGLGQPDSGPVLDAARRRLRPAPTWRSPRKRCTGASGRRACLPRHCGCTRLRTKPASGWTCNGTLRRRHWRRWSRPTGRAEATTAITLERLRLPLGPKSLAAGLGTLFADAVPDEGWPLRRGLLILDGRLDWPLEPESGADLVLQLEDAGLALGHWNSTGWTWRPAGKAAGSGDGWTTSI
ncbi:MAG: hypothetical protein U5R48_00415 [Gammaproteobacteria bacterium]|nr:hypothetical protein [Gammaproteobacteria bacterium]